MTYDFMWSLEGRGREPDTFEAVRSAADDLGDKWHWLQPSACPGDSLGLLQWEQWSWLCSVQISIDWHKSRSSWQTTQDVERHQWLSCYSGSQNASEIKHTDVRTVGLGAASLSRARQFVGQSLNFSGSSQKKPKILKNNFVAFIKRKM